MFWYEDIQLFFQFPNSLDYFRESNNFFMHLRRFDVWVIIENGISMVLIIIDFRLY